MNEEDREDIESMRAKMQLVSHIVETYDHLLGISPEKRNSLIDEEIKKPWKSGGLRGVRARRAMLTEMKNHSSNLREIKRQMDFYLESKKGILLEMSSKCKSAKAKAFISDQGVREMCVPKSDKDQSFREIREINQFLKEHVADGQVLLADTKRATEFLEDRSISLENLLDLCRGDIEGKFISDFFSKFSAHSKIILSYMEGSQQISGFVLTHEKDLEPYGSGLHVDLICTSEKTRGLGKILMNAVESSPLLEGLPDFVTLDATKKAQGFYEKLGFVSTDRINEDHTVPLIKDLRRPKIKDVLMFAD